MLNNKNIDNLIFTIFFYLKHHKMVYVNQQETKYLNYVVAC